MRDEGRTLSASVCNASAVGRVQAGVTRGTVRPGAWTTSCGGDGPQTWRHPLLTRTDYLDGMEKR